MSEDQTEEMLTERRQLLLEFLDIRFMKDRIEFLQKNKENIDGEFLMLAAQCMDFVETKSDFEDRFWDMIRYLKTKERFERKI